MSSSMGMNALGSIGWSVVDKWGTRLSSLLVIIILGRILGAEAFGIIALATTYTALAMILVNSGFSRSLVQKSALTEDDKSTAFSVTLIMATLLAVVTFFLAPLIADLLKAPTLGPVLQVLSLSLFINGISSVPAALLEREFRFKTLAIRRASGTLSGAVVAIVCALCGLGVWSLVAQSIVTSVVSAIVLWATTEWRPSLRLSRESFNTLRTVGFSVLGIELVAYINSQADKLLVGIVLGPELLGYYYMALQVITVITSLFSSVFGSISLTTFSRVQHVQEELRTWFLRLTTLSSFASVPVFALVAASAPSLVPVVLGSQWGASVPVLQILCLLGVINSAIMFDRNLLIAAGQGGRAFRMTLGQAALGVLLILPALNFGIMGVAVAVVARQYLFWPFRLLQVYRALPLKLWEYFKGWLVPTVIGIASFMSACLVAFLISAYWTTNDVAILIGQTLTWTIVTSSSYFFFARGIASWIRSVRNPLATMA